MTTGYQRYLKIVMLVTSVVVVVYALHLLKQTWRVRERIDEPLAQVLPNSNPIQIEYITDARTWTTIYSGEYPELKTPASSIRLHEQLGDFNVSSNTKKLFLLVKVSNGFHTTAPPAKENGGFVFYLWGENERSTPPHPYVYIPETGELGRGHEWCYVPPAFKAWMKTLKPESNRPVVQESDEMPLIVSTPPATYHKQ